MAVFAKIRKDFTVALGAVLHEAGTIVAVTEAEFASIVHKVEELTEDVAVDLHLSQGHALAVSPALGAAKYPMAPSPASETGNAGGAAPAAAAPVVPAADAPPAAGAAQESAPVQVDAAPIAAVVGGA
jgi:hypothetical protein